MCSPPSRSLLRSLLRSSLALGLAWLVLILGLPPDDGRVEHPRVLAPSALGTVDDQRALAKRHPGEPALGDMWSVTGQDEGAKVEMAGRDPAVAQCRGGRESQHGLGDVVAGFRLDASPHGLSVRLAGFGTD